VQELNCKEGVYGLGDLVGKEALSSNLPPKFKPKKKTPTSFPNHLLESA
jgi:hypothetical protein